MQIKGLVKASLIDYPGKIACVLFTGGCNFRCPFCQNTQLVLEPGALPDIPKEEVLASLAQRRGFIDGIVVSGGEPTLQPDLPDLLADLKKLGFSVKLDTNGYRPDVIEELIASGLVDYVAMDVKSSRGKYHLAAGVPVQLERIEQSIASIIRSGIVHEFRTTVVPGLVGPEDVGELADMIHGASRYALQQFRPEGVLDPAMRKLAPFPAHVLQEMAQELCARGVPTLVRGV